ncbi:MAG: hypothetical protein U9Q90_01175 [Campylobacterota bacterium]|nr:hypothetical protein [Campylobacterota bacterium]
MKEVDGGNVYGLGYRYRDFKLTQYFSDYKHFDVYQTDVQYTFKKKFDTFRANATIIGRYIHLDDKESNNFSKNAKDDYFTTGLKAHVYYHQYNFGAGAFFGKRIFAVMNGGFRVQHHAMEFNRTYMGGIGRTFDDLDLKG